MTTVAVSYVYRRRPKIKMAADTFVHTPTAGYQTTKIVRCGETLVGCAGTSEMCQKFIHWRLGGAVPKLGRSAFEAIVADETGVYLYNNSCTPERLRGRDVYYAIGSGRQYAMGALAVGADPENAVTIACMFDPFSKLPIEKVQL